MVLNSYVFFNFIEVQKSMKTSAELRTAFLEYFRERGHEVVPSSSLVPANDPTLLFTNAGMVPFKDVFLGKETRNYVRAASAQRCVRAGGKHNDLENVGYTARHHTFFEMLGNFSFGDYFKREAIQFAWEFLTVSLGLPAEKLWITVYEEDDETADIWLKEMQVDPARFARIGAKDNFWSMGDTGPCGPCSEIFYDHGEDIAGGPPGSPDEDGDRYIEIWNLVFMQYDRDKDGVLHPLPKPSVDTGMGLERLAAILQGGHSNYDIDLFQHLIAAVMAVSGCEDKDNNSLKVIADHIRSCSFLVVDGVMPSNEGRGYVLRRIIRRAVRHGHKLGVRDPFFYKLVAALVTEMGEAYPELVQAQALVERVLKQEEERFAETLDQGMAILENVISELSGRIIPGEMVFKLYDTYGFPVDLTADIARERDLELDMAGFDKAMAAQRERARSANSFAIDYGDGLKLEGKTEFSGYEQLSDLAVIRELLVDGNPCERLEAGQKGMLVLDQTPFYAESGGQVGDSGRIFTETAEFEVQNTQKQGKVFVHIGRMLKGALATGDKVSAQVDGQRRQAIAGHHSATHLLHAALRDLLGEHVSQKGSQVSDDRLRFDFSHFEPISPEQLDQIEALVNQHIRHNHEVVTRIMDQDAAKSSGAMALFGEKYEDRVRVLSMGDFSVELCGGTHVRRTGDIGLFKIISETGVAAGVRRIEAMSGSAALQWVTEHENVLTELAALLKSTPETLRDKVQQLLEKNRTAEKELEQLKGRLASSRGDDLVQQATEIGGIKVLVAKLEGADPQSLRDTVDQMKQKMGSAAIVLSTVKDGKVSLIAGVSKDCTDRIKAGELVNAAAEKVGGRGGGRPDMAQAGGNQPENLELALAAARDWIESRLSI
ncbi:Alanyl-tRNA synthetase [hydrothermal vent metagenome]|uniref:Alanine--tRNA ligase n=1 Tax=hydrothermal vent metagenome TaxID=652676 RepID=A0A3B1BCJ6_9ZZZZ